MKELLRIFVKFHRIFLFILLEIICFVLIVSNNNYHRSVYISSANAICGSIYEYTNNISSFVNLKRVNEELLIENTELRNKVIRNSELKDSVFLLNNNKFLYRFAKVINKSVNRADNSITLNKGSKDGIKKEMAVICYQGVVGVVANTSEHYCTVLPVINQSLSLSAKIKRNNYFGSLTWDNKDYKQAILKDIPFHANVMKGDSIVTSGYSSIFPEGILIAIIDSHEHENGDNFLSIKVNLNVNFKTLEYVYIIENLEKEEQQELESIK